MKGGAGTSTGQLSGAVSGRWEGGARPLIGQFLGAGSRTWNAGESHSLVRFNWSGFSKVEGGAGLLSGQFVGAITGGWEAGQGRSLSSPHLGKTVVWSGVGKVKRWKARPDGGHGGGYELMVQAEPVRKCTLVQYSASCVVHTLFFQRMRASLRATVVTNTRCQFPL